MKRQMVVGCSLLVVGIASLMLPGCRKEDDLPPNPYDGVNYGSGGGGGQDTLDPVSITGLHRNIFSVRCAVPGCHDGNFEPDFRSVQSAFSTLVYHPVIKNNAANDFRFRVVPYDTAKSVLHERITNCCFVNQDDRMPQDNIGVPLPQENIDDIAAWIMNGARDAAGNVAKFPNLEPYLAEPFYVAIDDKIPPTIIWSDTAYRAGGLIYNPFEVPDSINFVLVFYVRDDSTAVKDMLVNQVKMSLKPDDFTTGWTANATYLSVPPNEYWVATVNTTPLPKDTMIFFRYYMNDGDHAQNSEMPRDGLVYEYKTYFAFKVKP